MKKIPTYVSFDYDNDRALKDLIVGQSRHPKSPFNVIDQSIKKSISRNWEIDAERRIKRSDVVLVIVGAKTYSAQGVIKEVALAKKHCKTIIQVIGPRNMRNPTPVRGAGKIYRWKWNNLEKIYSTNA